MLELELIWGFKGKRLQIILMKQSALTWKTFIIPVIKIYSAKWQQL